MEKCKQVKNQKSITCFNAQGVHAFCTSGRPFLVAGIPARPFGSLPVRTYHLISTCREIESIPLISNHLISRRLLRLPDVYNKDKGPIALVALPYYCAQQIAIIDSKQMTNEYRFETPGYCDICETSVVFQSEFTWFRDHLLCPVCRSVPRERALMRVIDLYMPKYSRKSVHESSPGGRGVSAKLGRICRGYTYSHFFPDVPLGLTHNTRKERCESLEALTFGDESFDLFITQDVMEHIFDPAAAFREIARVLKPNGMHILTVPLVNKCTPTERRAKRAADGTIEYLADPVYHGNPIDDEGSLVTIDWGYDIIEFIREESGLSTHMITIDEIERGIRAEFIEVLVCQKF